MTHAPAPDLSLHRTTRLVAVFVLTLLMVETFSFLTRRVEMSARAVAGFLTVHLLFGMLLWSASLFFGFVFQRIKSPSAAHLGILISISSAVIACGDRGITIVGTLSAVVILMVALHYLSTRWKTGIELNFSRVALYALVVSLLAKGTLLVHSTRTTPLLGICLGFFMFLAAGCPVSKGRLRIVIRWIPAGCAMIMTLYLLLRSAPVGPPDFAGSADSGKSSKGIVLIVLDTLRFDLVTPQNISSAFPECFSILESHFHAGFLMSPAPSTLPSHATLFTGLPVRQHGAHQPAHDDPDPPWYAYKLTEDKVTIAERLKGMGYRTAAESGNYAPLAPTFGLSQGFDYYNASRNKLNRYITKQFVSQCFPVLRLLQSMTFPVYGYDASTPYRNASLIAANTVRLLESMRNSPFFLFVNLFDMHSPYLPPEYWRIRHETGADWIIHGEPADNLDDRYIDGRIGLRDDQLEFIDRLYRSQSLYLDRYLARILQRIDMSTTLVIIVADHGESLGEHGLLKHSTSLYCDQVLVPYWIHLPETSGLEPNDNHPANFIAIHDLMLRWAGIAVKSNPDRLMQVSEIYSARHPVYLNGERSLFTGEAVSLYDPPYKLIKMNDGGGQLFDLETDPGETTDLSGSMQGLVSVMEERMEGYFEVFKDPDSGMQPAQPHLTDEEKEALQTLGYVN